MPEIYELLKMSDGSVLVRHGSPMFPVVLEKKINEMAGGHITEFAPGPSFMPNLVQSFFIKPEHADLFLNKIAGYIFGMLEPGKFFVKEELAPEI